MNDRTKETVVVIALLLAGCGGPIDCRNNESILRAKSIETLVDKPGGRVEPWDYQWSQSIKSTYPECWNEGVER